MKAEKKEIEEPVEETAAKLYYEMTVTNGNIYVTINAAAGSEVKVMSGQPTNPGPKPPGHG